MTTTVDPLRPERVARFATYFKNYMGISTIVAAALPIPVTSMGLLPMFHAHQRLFSVYTSLFCFLTLAYVFYIRHLLAKIMFRGPFSYSAFPILPIAGALVCLWLYHLNLQIAIGAVKDRRHYPVVPVAYNQHGSGGPTGATGPTGSYASTRNAVTTKDVLATTELDEIPGGTGLIFQYIGVFAFAELAFVLMATREYMQDVLKLDDAVLYAG